jgi:hypothetical protein
MPATTAWYQIGSTGPIRPGSQPCNSPLTRGDKFNCECPRGDLNPHALLRALAPQASASTYSATRTCCFTSLGRPRTIAIRAAPSKGSNGPSATCGLYQTR